MLRSTAAAAGPFGSAPGGRPGMRKWLENCPSGSSARQPCLDGTLARHALGAGSKRKVCLGIWTKPREAVALVAPSGPLDSEFDLRLRRRRYRLPMLRAAAM
jgi:hypothetical protein